MGTWLGSHFVRLQCTWQATFFCAFYGEGVDVHRKTSPARLLRASISLLVDLGNFEARMCRTVLKKDTWQLDDKAMPIQRLGINPLCEESRLIELRNVYACILWDQLDTYTATLNVHIHIGWHRANSAFDGPWKRIANVELVEHANVVLGDPTTFDLWALSGEYVNWRMGDCVF
jgi:hypothetical protein